MAALGIYEIAGTKGQKGKSAVASKLLRNFSEFRPEIIFPALNFI